MLARAGPVPLVLGLGAEMDVALGTVSLGTSEESKVRSMRFCWLVGGSSLEGVCYFFLGGVCLVWGSFPNLIHKLSSCSKSGNSQLDRGEFVGEANLLRIRAFGWYSLTPLRFTCAE